MSVEEQLRRAYLARTAQSAAIVRYSGAWTVSAAPTWTPGLPPILVREASGSSVTDVDGNAYVDMTMGFGVHHFGHGARFLRDAFARVLDDGLGAGVLGESYLSAVEALSRHTDFPCIHFTTTGSEAVMSAVRIARVRTKRELVVRFAGHYHGHADTVLDSDPRTSLVLEYGAPSALAALREALPRAAAVLFSPVTSLSPRHLPAAFIAELTTLARRSGTAVIADEVLTGFRFGVPSLTTAAAVRPDICVFGKLLGGGHPIGVVATTPDWLEETAPHPRSRAPRDVLPRAFLAGTFNRSVLATSACRAVLLQLERSAPLERSLERRCEKFTSTLASVLDDGIARVSGRGPLVTLAFRARCVAELVALGLLVRGVYVRSVVGARIVFFVSRAHSARTLSSVVSIVGEAVSAAARATSGGDSCPMDRTGSTRNVA